MQVVVHKPKAWSLLSSSKILDNIPSPRVRLRVIYGKINACGRRTVARIFVLGTTYL